jgi:hypothetical protein
MSSKSNQGVPLPLTDADLISNRALGSDDQDDFGYGAIAGRVAETILALEPPLTIGLFGPWGSGKTSICELLRRELKAKDRKARLVYYDASTYGGEALKRNFISHIAGELGYDSKGHPEFHQGLYESRRRTELDFEAVKKTLRPTAQLFLLLYLGFLLLFCLLAGITSLGTSENFLGQIGETLPQLIAPTAIGGLIVAIVTLLMKGATLDAEQSRPASDEAFAKCFQDLLDRGRKDRKFKRLVVFVDELDRCSSDDVVKTLTAIRTFLNQKHAVFIVAADRAALERALDEKLPQPTPVNGEDPYYSSASSFFDKIFHDRVPLPPLRGPRLYEWAFEKVKARGGYWAALRGGSDRKLRKILYFLIPSHVRAPRRVKVLLNSFIRSTAIAAHSGLDWDGRAREIAKLTVIDTEFPQLGADLRIEHRLPELLLMPPSAPSPRVQRLLDKHGGYRISRSAKDGEVPGTLEQQEAEEAEDHLLANATPAEREALIHAEHEQLRRYLARTRDVRIGRDLLFLDPAGAAVGIEDAELADLLDQAVDAPADVIAALEGRDTDTRRLAARVLANMAEQEFGEERINVITALMGVIELLSADVEDVVDEIAGSVQSFARDEELAPEHLVGALRLAVSDGGGQQFMGEILADDRLLLDQERLVSVCTILPRIPESRRKRIYESVAALVIDDRLRFISILRDLPTQDAANVLSSEDVYGAVFRYLGPEAPEPGANDQFAEEIYEIAVEAGEEGAALGEAMQRLLVKEEISYGPLKAHAAEVFPGLDDPEMRDKEVLAILIRFDYRDPAFWTAFLTDGVYSSKSNGDWAVQIIVDALSALRQAELSEVDDRRALIESVLPFAKMAGDGACDQIRDALVSELTAVAWWSDEGSRQRQEGLHEIGLFLARELEGDCSVEIKQALSDDLSRAVMDPSAFSNETWLGLTTMGGGLEEGADSLLRVLEPLEVGDLWPVWLTRVRVALAVAARKAGSVVESDVVTEEAILSAASSDSPHGREAVADWLLLGPNADAVRGLIATLADNPHGAIQTSYAHWAEDATQAERTRLAQSLVDSEDESSRWLDVLVRAGVDEVALVHHIGSAIRAAARGERREELTLAVARIRPVSAATQKDIADLIIELVGTGKQVDFKAAINAIPALGKDHRSAGRLRQAFQNAAELNGHQLSERAAIQLGEAGVRVPKKAVKKGAWGRFKDLFG